jgi:hypothetical protein
MLGAALLMFSNFHGEIRMRSLVITLFLFGATVANAAAVVVTFDELDPVFPAATIDSQGYRFTANGAGMLGIGSNWGVLGTPALAMAGDSDTMDLSGDGTFSLLSFNMSTFSGSETVVVTGYLQSGGQLSTTLNITGSYAPDYGFSAAWQGLESVQFDSVGGSLLYIDNIVTNVVPVPAAIWLFGSALAGLGWLRRRQTV